MLAGIGIGTSFIYGGYTGLDALPGLVHWLNVEDLGAITVQNTAVTAATATGGTIVGSTFTENAATSNHYVAPDTGPACFLTDQTYTMTKAGTGTIATVGHRATAYLLDAEHDYTNFVGAGAGHLSRTITGNGTQATVMVRSVSDNPAAVTPSQNKPSVSYVGTGTDAVTINSHSYYNERYTTAWVQRKGGVSFGLVNQARCAAFSLKDNMWSSQLGKKCFTSAVTLPLRGPVGAWSILHQLSNTVVFAIYQHLTNPCINDSQGASVLVTFTGASINPGVSVRVPNSGNVITTIGNGSTAFSQTCSRGTATPFTVVTVSTEVIDASTIRKITRVYSNSTVPVVTDSGPVAFAVTANVGSNTDLLVNYNYSFMQPFEYGIYDRVLSAAECDFVAGGLLTKWG